MAILSLKFKENFFLEGKNELKINLKNSFTGFNQYFPLFLDWPSHYNKDFREYIKIDELIIKEIKSSQKENFISFILENGEKFIIQKPTCQYYQELPVLWEPKSIYEPVEKSIKNGEALDENNLKRILYMLNVLSKYTTLEGYSDGNEMDFIRELIKVKENQKIQKIENDIKEYIVLGDLHGDLKSLLAILAHSKAVPNLILRKDFGVVFLGDYIDRSIFDHQVLRSALILKALFPEKIYLLRGNHDDFEVGEIEKVEGEIHEYTEYYYERQKNKFSKEFLMHIDDYLESMCYILLDDVLKIFYCHGGVPPFNAKGEYTYFEKIEDLSSDIKISDEEIPREKFSSRDILWARIGRNDEYKFDSSKYSYYFGKRELEKFLKKIQFNIMIKGHCPPSFYGLDKYFDGLAYALHSTGGEYNICNWAYGDIKFPTYLKINRNDNKINAYHIVHYAENIEETFDNYNLFAIEQKLW